MKILITVCALMIVISGCGSELGTFAAGAVGGGALSGTIAGAEADLERAKQQKLAELETALVELDSAKDEVQKTAAQAKVKALEKKVENLTDIQTGTKLVKAGTKIDWSDPAAVGGFGSTAISAALAIYFRRKQKRENRKRSAEKVGVRKTIKVLAALPSQEAITAPMVESLIFNNIGIERANQEVA